ncbi:ISL3 family transposase [Dactylosporangium sp. NBC_01737]|uniref:ISL3 family transposase n=1 Tax=Dactylosporangium sp. NBC_01737 TaxID=2975959 RepID=UPI002E15DEFF|nr:ISL3 family transposase [Dactylosporangium sp. NBC_01737]
MRVHSRYRRRLADLAIAGRRVLIQLMVRRFFCTDASCDRKIFAEQIGLASRYARRTDLAGGVLETVALALGGRPGARMTDALEVPVNRMTLLRVIRRIPDRPVQAPEVLGVDDFAIKKGQNYATILLDMATHRPIDVLPDRTADTFAAWLRQHPGVRVICRDRGGNYAIGARAGAPEAIQVADRYHLWANLGEAVEKTVLAHRACLHPPEPTTGRQTEPAPVQTAPPPDGVRDVHGRDRPLVTRTQERYAAVQTLLAQGKSLSAICRELNLERGTVRRFARAESLDELLFKATHRVTKLDPFKAYLIERWNHGQTDAAALFRDLLEQGYQGGKLTVRRFLHQFRGHQHVPRPGPRPIKPRHATRWIMTRPDRLKDADRACLRQIRDRCPELNRTADYVRAFAVMMTGRQGGNLEHWLTTIEGDDLPALRSLAIGMRRDQEAITNGLTLPHSSGAVEGAVTRAKAIKRAMYGRANLDLLRKRILAQH